MLSTISANTDKTAAAYPWVKRLSQWLPKLFGMAVLFAGLYAVIALYAVKETTLAIAFLIYICIATYIFISSRTYAMRYLIPGISTIFLFILLPLFFTIVIGLTNTSGRNLLSQEQVEEYLLARTFSNGDEIWQFNLRKSDEGHILVLRYKEKVFISPHLDLEREYPNKIALTEQDTKAAIPGDPVEFRKVIQYRAALKKLQLSGPEEKVLVMSGLRGFAPNKPLYTKLDNGYLRQNQNGKIYYPDTKSGFYISSDGEKITPGFRTFVGLNNFYRILMYPGIWQPFLQIFVWTVIFAGCTVLFTFVLGLVLAAILQWERISFRGVYRLLLILPYAVPAFVSIQVFRGLFNQEFGEINLILSTLLGIKPEWFTDPLNAKIMILIVNTWLGFPYMMLLAMGLLQSIPRDLYKAAAVEGAKPIDNFFRITLPMILPSFTPLLIASFAFNFNNFVLIILLTGGRPDILGATTPAGTTDLLVSFTYRIAFENSAQDFGLASAISTIIFFLVGAIAIINIWVLQRKDRGFVKEGRL